MKDEQTIRPAARKCLTVGNLKIDNDGADILIGDETIKVTPAQRAILLLLVGQMNKAVPRDMLVNALVEQGHKKGDKSLNVHICLLKKRLARAGVKGFVINNLFGYGYQAHQI